jgi:hypothetical protein
MSVVIEYEVRTESIVRPSLELAKSLRIPLRSLAARTEFGDSLVLLGQRGLEGADGFGCSGKSDFEILDTFRCRALQKIVDKSLHDECFGVSAGLFWWRSSGHRKSPTERTGRTRNRKSWLLKLELQL